MNTKKFHHIVPEIHIGKHHEDYPAIEKMFFTVVNNFLNCFQDICNSFKEDEPIVLDTDEVMIPEIQSCFGNLLEMNEENIKTFVNVD